MRAVSPQARLPGPDTQALLGIAAVGASTSLKQEGCTSPGMASAASAMANRTIRILDLKGMELAVVLLGDVLLDGRFLHVARVERGSGQLLNYRFSAGQRNVLLVCDGSRHPARLATRWANNRREWRLELVAPRLARTRLHEADESTRRPSSRTNPEEPGGRP